MVTMRNSHLSIRRNAESWNLTSPGPSRHHRKTHAHMKGQGSLHRTLRLLSPKNSATVFTVMSISNKKASRFIQLKTGHALTGTYLSFFDLDEDDERCWCPHKPVQTETTS